MPKQPKQDNAKHAPIIPGEFILGTGDIQAFEGRATIELTVANHGDRPIQVGSHCHFFEANRALRFDREQTFGFRLKIPSGTAVRFEPGQTKDVELISFSGEKKIFGFNKKIMGKL